MLAAAARTDQPPTPARPPSELPAPVAQAPPDVPQLTLAQSGTVVRRHGRLASPLGLALAVVTAVGVAVVADRLDAGRPAMPPAAARADVRAAIIHPGDGQTVDSPIVVSGTAELPDGQALWLLLGPPDGSYYLTGGKTALGVAADGSWSARVSLGRDQRDNGFAYDLVLVIAPAEGTFARDARQKKNAPGDRRLATLTDETRRVAAVRVTLGRQHDAVSPP